MAPGFSQKSILMALLCLTTLSVAQAAVVVRQEIEPGVFAAVRNGEMLILECRLPRGDKAIQGLLGQYLAATDEWRLYRSANSVAIRFDRLNPKAQRKFLETLFPDDYVDEAGWWHAIAFEGEYGESIEALAAWFSGDRMNAQAIRQAPENQRSGPAYRKGDRVLIPAKLLNDVMRVPTPRPPPLQMKEEPEFVEAAGDLVYAQDREGGVAIYRLKKGEALYSSVVVRFTDIRENADIHEAIGIIAARSSLKDPNRVTVGQRIAIPMEMLSDRYQPAGSERRRNFEAVQQEAKVLQAIRTRSKDLEGVVIVLDPGHGGRDHGASHKPSGLYEDELNYDIASRIKRVLESTTQARVHMTLLDPEQGYEPTNRTRFVHDTNEILLTTPHYANHDARISANLRWALANRMYREELKKGTNKDKMLFASIHCDALFNDKLRGAMVYVPGADYRKDREQHNGMLQATYAEVREQMAVTTTAEIRRRDEALSRNFAEVLLKNFHQHNPKIPVHSTGDPIRNVIRQSGGVAYVPAVIRNSEIPTKILLECANLMSEADRKNLADPEWRQALAEAFVEAVKEYFGD